MLASVKMHAATVDVLRQFLANPTAELHGYELCRRTGLQSGTVKPMLDRLAAAGWLTSSWEQLDPTAQGRPPRRYFRLTPQGRDEASAAVGRVDEKRQGSTPRGSTRGRRGSDRAAVQSAATPAGVAQHTTTTEREQKDQP